MFPRQESKEADTNPDPPRRLVDDGRTGWGLLIIQKVSWMGGATRIVLATNLPDGIAVAEVVAPDSAMFADLEYGNDANAQRLLGDFAGLDRPTTCPILLDLRGVKWVNSGGFALILIWWRQSQSAGLLFGLCLSPAVREVVEVSRLERVIPCFDSLSEAISGLSHEA